MNKAWIFLCAAGLLVFGVDQAIKLLFLEGFRWEGDFFSLILTFNKGVAFSMFAFLEEYLKYLQIVLIAALGIYLAMHRDVLLGHASAIGMIAGAALSNIYDRFIHGGVVDYFFWHYGFNFAVFNFADVMIDVGVLCILYRTWKRPNPTK
ncbi:MAG: lipoprotein signal peptidase [Epsilonproteobacteria bacterium]|jgi:signal peptidase II|uniref:signal peptidase II n=1 Tax=Sulfurospirillum TaxID=57665 RepID=UPI0005A80567|nr:MULTISPECIES: signal peptidase II [Sulfurospirillum]MCP3652444.1 signal peptidase II [Sulfurospirillum sp. DNRA8]MCR1811295.1 signal peptidase II [Sulfurospirillum sp. DNRA8]NCB54021.1 lipoprotein signal peptidase [Campylobacterota bacterium]